MSHHPAYGPSNKHFLVSGPSRLPEGGRARSGFYAHTSLHLRRGEPRQGDKARTRPAQQEQALTLVTPCPLSTACAGLYTPPHVGGEGNLAAYV